MLDPIAREEYLAHEYMSPEEGAVEVYRDRLWHPHDLAVYQRLLRGVAGTLRRWPEVQRLIVIGGGCGWEGALLSRWLPSLRQVLILDIGWCVLRLVPDTWAHVGAATPVQPVLADFTTLPLRRCGPDTVGLAFRYLHHAHDITATVRALQSVLCRLILVEPV